MAEFAVWQQNVAYPARYDRALVAELFGEGVIDVSGGSLRVTERAAGANMSVTPRQGRCVVDGDEQADQETYVCIFDGAVNLSVASADPDNPRKDRVIVRVQDSAVSGSSDGPVREVLTGTPAVSPTAPAVPDSAISLAIVDVAAGASSITDADITDDRSRAWKTPHAYLPDDHLADTTAPDDWPEGASLMFARDGFGPEGATVVVATWVDATGSAMQVIGNPKSSGEGVLQWRTGGPGGWSDWARAASRDYVDEGYATANDLSDVTEHSGFTGADSTTITVVDLSTAGLLLGGKVQGYQLSSVTLTIDGTANSLTVFAGDDSAANDIKWVQVPPVRFDSNCKLRFTTGTGTTEVHGMAWTKP